MESGKLAAGRARLSALEKDVRDKGVSSDRPPSR
jgi:hypothetical protein